MEERSQILNAQRRWAEGAGYAPCSRGYLACVDDNLFSPLSLGTLDAFRRGSGSELKDRQQGPAKMRALHSSSALAVNVFDYWANNTPSPLFQALGLEGYEGASIRFEVQYSTGLRGVPPNLDVVIERTGVPVAAIESKFTEWVPSKAAKAPAFKSKYFPTSGPLWSSAGLFRSQQLASKLQISPIYRHLDAAQLLKHGLGLARSTGGKFRLFYIYFDTAGEAGERHKAEIADFSAAIGSELGFQAPSYQELFRALFRLEAGSAAYRDYIQNRYLHGAA